MVNGHHWGRNRAEVLICRSVVLVSLMTIFCVALECRLSVYCVLKVRIIWIVVVDCYSH